MSSIHFVGGEKGGVGKSVFSRLLSQYFLDNNLLYAGFDADQSHDTLSRFYPEFTQAINLDTFEGADEIMETALSDDLQVVVDLPAQSERFLNRWIDENDVAGLCQETDIDCNFWYVVDDGRDSARLAAAFLKRYGNTMKCTLVRNFGRGGDFSLLEDTLASVDAPYSIIDLAELHDGTMRQIDRLNLNFWAAANVNGEGKESLSLMQRQRTRVWIKKAANAIQEGLAVKSEELSPESV